MSSHHPNTATPSAAPAGRPPTGRGARPGVGAGAQRETTGERGYFCRTCLIAARGQWVPTGWYMVERAVGGSGMHRRLGLFCSLGCLIDAEASFVEAEAVHNRLIGLADDPARARARLLDTAQTMLGTGMTVRQVGDSLGVPTKALRAWLTAVGVEVPTTPPPPPAAASGVRAGTAVSTRNGPGVGGERPALVLVNELTQAGHLRATAWTLTAEGPPHAPAFTARLDAEALQQGRWVPVGAAASAATKAAARTAAAEALTAQLTRP